MTKDHPAERRDVAPPISDDVADRALALAMSVRNALEGTLHGGELGDLSLTDEQMSLLNPVVRNAIATGLHAEAHYFTHQAARAYLDFQRRLIPEYWERPELLDEYVELWPSYAGRTDENRRTCRRCGRAIINIGTGPRARWTHIAADGGLNVGCAQRRSPARADGTQNYLVHGRPHHPQIERVGRGAMLRRIGRSAAGRQPLRGG